MLSGCTSPAMRHSARTLARLMVVTLAALPPLTCAALPDVTTTPGFWNDDDDVLMLGTPPFLAGHARDLVSLGCLATDRPLVPEKRQRLPTAPLFGGSSRAPPTGDEPGVGPGPGNAVAVPARAWSPVAFDR